MNRKVFIKNAAIAATAAFVSNDIFAKPKKAIYGHNDMRYKIDTKWSRADSQKNPVNDCHEMVQDAKGRLYLITNETKNNILVYNKSGKLINTWGHEFPGGHGLTLADENDKQYLFITDTVKHQVYKTTLDGKILFTINAPLESGLYKNATQFEPTEVAVAKNGEFYISDGYGLQYILHYDATGKLKNCFGGKGVGDHHLDNAHGICVDYRKAIPTLLVTDRTRNCFKRFSMDGQLIEVIKLPGACVCRPVIKNDFLYAAVLRSPALEFERSGFVTILDKDNKVISNIGGSQPVYENGVLKPMYQTDKIFMHPHDVCVDDDDNLYVTQWNSGKVYPYKFKRV